MKRNEKGFTLIEIIVVIVMIGVLAAIAVPIYSGYILKARASEGITTLGAIKIFTLERRNSLGRWPTKEEIETEFNQFKELYYFKQSIVLKPDTPITQNQIAIRLDAEDPGFGLPDGFTDPYIQLDISFTPDGTNTGWSGGIVEKYAKHLPPCSNPL